MSEANPSQQLTDAEVLALINQKRSVAGLPLMGGFASLNRERRSLNHQEMTQAGMAAVKRRREELSDRPLYQVGTLEDEINFAGRNGLLPEPEKLPEPTTSLPHPQDPSGNHFSEEIPVWPQILMDSIKLNCSGPYRIWSLARGLDPQGSGSIETECLYEYLKWAHVNRKTYNRWINAAKNAGLIRLVGKNGKRITYCSLEKAALLLGAVEIGPRVKIPTKKLVSKEWRAYVWAARQTQYTGAPISRATLEKTTGVNHRTQVNYERKGVLHTRKNYAVDERYSGDMIDGYREFHHPHAFVINYFSIPMVARQIPNSYIIPSQTAVPNGGLYRSKVIKMMLRRNMPAVVSETTRRCDGDTLIALSDSREAIFSGGDANCDGTTLPGSGIRRYFERYKALKRTKRKIGKRRLPRTDLYEKIDGVNRRQRRTNDPSSTAIGWWRIEEA